MTNADLDQSIVVLRQERIRISKSVRSLTALTLSCVIVAVLTGFFAVADLLYERTVSIPTTLKEIEVAVKEDRGDISRRLQRQAALTLLSTKYCGDTKRRTEKLDRVCENLLAEIPPQLKTKIINFGQL